MFKTFQLRTMRDWVRLTLSLAITCAIGYVLGAFDSHPAGVSMADNVLLTINMITNEALRVLENNLVITRHVNRQYDGKFGVEGAKIGTTLNVRKPPRYSGRTGQALEIEDAVETQVPLTLDTQFGVDIDFSSADLALSIDMFSDRFIKPAVATVANKIDYDVAQLYKKVYSIVGTPGTVPTQLLTYLLAGVNLDNNAAPQDEQRSVIITPLMQAYIVDALKGLFNQAAQISEQYMKGKMGVGGGFSWFMDQNIATHTVGAWGASTPLVDGANQADDTLLTDGWESGLSTLNEGDTFTIDGVYSVNPQSRQSTTQLQSFVVTQTISDTTGAMNISISPTIIISGAFQTVSNSPANNAPITVLGAPSVSTPQGLAFHKDAFTLATADLPLPRGVDMAARVSDDQVGISIRMVRAYDINSDHFPCRLDVLYGCDVLRPELASRIAA